MDSRCFMFDLVILNVWIDDFDYENNTLSIEACFNDTEFTIESNPERPNEFKQGRTCEFNAYPEELGLELLDHPLKLKILANGEEIKGEAELIWPKEMLEKLERQNFVQYSNFDGCDLILDHVVTGKINIQYRLRAKCELSESDENEIEKRCDIQNELKRIVDPNELFFLIQDDSDMCDPLNDGLKRKNETDPTALDLSKFKNFHGKVLKDPKLIDQFYRPDCCHTKKFSAYNSKPTFSCVNSKPSLQKPVKKSDKCLASKSSIEWACKASRHIQECPHSNKFSDETTETCSCSSSELSTELDSEGCNMNEQNMYKYPAQSPPVLKETVYIRPRLCPICKSDVSWLPKMAPCTKCGHKPLPYTLQKNYNENLTADQILADWAVDSPMLKVNGEKPGSKRTNRCICKNGKVCAYCRIRKICKDVLKTKKSSRPNAKRSTDSDTFLKDQSVSRMCKYTSENDSRTHLAKVFSELQDLYNLKPVALKHELDLNKKCEKSFAVSRTSKCKRSPTTNIEKKKENSTKNVLIKAKRKLCKKKLYNYKSVRNYPGTLIGHAACVSSGKVVPGNMGWLWTANTVGMRRGWKPGAIRKPIKEIMKYFLKDYPVDSLNVSKFGKKKISKRISEELIQKPTLHICKKNGTYIITMRPIKDATLLKNCADPYVPMKPIQFRIVQNPKKACAKQIKNILKEKFDKCSCHRPISECFCRTFLDKKRLEFELNKACRLKGIPNLKDSLILSDTSESETEFDFGVTPPAGVIKPQLKNKPDLECRETQYNEDDWIIKPTFPKPLNKYMKPFDATGGRTIPPARACPPVACVIRRENTRKLPVSGIVGGWGGVGGNKGAGRQTGGGPTNTKQLFCNLSRRGKADTCCSYQAPCMPIC